MRGVSGLIGLGLLATIVMLALLLTGCAPRPSANKSANPKRNESKKEGKALSQEIETGAAEGTAFSKGPNRQPIYRVQWRSGILEYVEGGNFAGRFRGVSGSFHQDGSEASTFRADAAQAFQETQVLRLEGNVEVRSAETQGVLRADWARYEAEAKRIVAGGNVRYETPEFTVGPFEILWGSPELKRIGTPDVFQKQNAKP